VVTASLLCLAVTATYGDTVVGGVGGKIYRRAKGATGWTLGYTDTGGDSILDILEYNGYLYWTTKNALHRVAIASNGLRNVTVVAGVMHGSAHKTINKQGA
jgi:hypothetical protein